MLKHILFYILITCGNLAVAATQEQEILAPDVQVKLHSNIINSVQPHLVFDKQEQADAWLDDMSNRLKKWVPDNFLRNRYLTIIQYEAARAGLDPQIILAIITIESKFNKYAISNAGARGMMQVMPFWQKQIGTSSQNLFDTETNIRYGCTILRYYLQLENGNLYRALAKYNGSNGKTWYPVMVMNAYNTYWQPYPVVELKNGKIKYINYQQ